VGETPLITLSANVSGGANTFLQWQSSHDKGSTWNDIAGATSNNYTASPPSVEGTYLYRLAVAQDSDMASIACRVASNPSTINVYTHPVPVLSSNSPVCEGGNLVLSATNGAEYKWTGPLNYSGKNNTTTVSNVDTTNSGKYYVDVTSDKGCTSRDSITAVVYKKPAINLRDPPAFCEGGSVTLNATGINLSGWKWTPSATLSLDNISNPQASPDSTTTYFVSATNGTCSSNESVKVTVINKPIAQAGSDKISFIGNSIMLNGNAGGSNVSVSWNPVTYLDQPTIATPLSAATTDIIYTLTVANVCGVSSDQVFVKVYPKTVPNAFSPNGDGINDTWNIPFLETHPEAVVNVYNRHGLPVYTTSGTYKPWDGTHTGKPLPVGTYYYTITGSTSLKYGGWVLIVR
jgi:gliding motility-associated-like protein